MKNPIYDEDYKALKKKAKIFYDKIDRVWCPVLNDHIIFRKAGFRHLIWKGGVFRLKSEQKRRLALVPHLANILQNQNSQPVYKSQGNAKFWAFTGEQDKKSVRVVIRQISDGEKHFFSVFEDKQKSTQ
jgi:hypothetical protein